MQNYVEEITIDPTLEAIAAQLRNSLRGTSSLPMEYEWNDE